MLNQFQFFLEKDHNPVRSVTDAPRVIVDGAFTGGGAQADVLDTENNLKINDILTYSRGRHLFKAGIVIPNLSRRAWEDHANRLGTTYYASTEALAAQMPSSSPRRQVQAAPPSGPTRSAPSSPIRYR